MDCESTGFRRFQELAEASDDIRKLLVAIIEQVASCERYPSDVIDPAQMEHAIAAARA